MFIKQSPQPLLSGTFTKSIPYILILSLLYLLLPGCSAINIPLTNDAAYKKLNALIKDKHVRVTIIDHIYEGEHAFVRPDSTFIRSPYSAFPTKYITKIQKAGHKNSELTGLAVGAGSGALLFGVLVAYLREGKNNNLPPRDFAPWTNTEGIGLGALLGALVGGGIGAAIGSAAGDGQDILISSQLDENLSIKEIETDVYLVTHSFPWASNSLVIKFKEGEYLFIDTPYTDEATEEVVKWLVGNYSGKLKISVINSHFHNDRLGGNAYLKKIGAAVYGSDLTAKLLKEKGLGNGMLDMLVDSSMQYYYDYWKNAKLTPPDSLFPLKNGITLSFDNETWEIYYPGPGHTQDNIVVYYPKKNILFGGCLIKSLESDSKGFVGDADLTNWYSSAKNILTKYPNASLVVPGHGQIGGKELITHTMDLVK